jgi:hypothetical protein
MEEIEHCGKVPHTEVKISQGKVIKKENKDGKSARSLAQVNE